VEILMVEAAGIRGVLFFVARGGAVGKALLVLLAVFGGLFSR
jgi:hypothetical protein